MASRIISLARSAAVRPFWACYIGYTAWLMIGASHSTPRTLCLPVVVHSVAPSSVIAPTHLMITVRGERAVVRALDERSMAVHIDGYGCRRGLQSFVIRTEHLILPPGVDLVSYVEIPLFIGEKSGSS